MKYIVYSFNYPTLCRALRYIDTQWGKENTTLIFASLVSPLPDAIKKEYNVLTVDGYDRSRIHGLKGFLADCLICRNSWKQLKHSMAGLSEVTLIVFRDNEPQEATLIEQVYRHFPNVRIHLWIIEEGFGLYATKRDPIKALKTKKLLYRLAGISLYALADQPQGMNPRIEKAICNQPDLVSAKFGKTIVEQQIPIFIPEFNKRFAEYVLDTQGQAPQVFDFVFLTTPIEDTFGNSTKHAKIYAQFLEKLVSTTATKGTLLIKSHPRDGHDYSRYANSKVKVCTSLENKIPFECLNSYYGNPQIITVFSSVSLYATNEKPVIFVNNLLGISSDVAQILNQKSEQAVISCNSFYDLSSALQPN